jgi:diacylglycerol kinase (ATP)
MISGRTTDVIIISIASNLRKSNMRVTLIHNPRAGEDDHPEVDEFLALISAAGHDVSCHSSKNDHLDRALEDPGDLVAVAGGDGTVGAVAGRLVGRRVPIAVLPLGTANNISTTLGLAGAPLERLIAGWAAALRMRFDVGVVQGPWGEIRFIEGIGVGLFARAICELDARADVTFGREDNREEKLTSALRWMIERVSTFPAEELTITLDGQDRSGEYILLEVMNIQHIGPSLHLAPDADPGDGLFDIVLINASERDKLGDYLANRLEGRPHRPQWKVHRGRHLRLPWQNSDLHIDDKVWPAPESTPDGAPVFLDVKLESHALEFLAYGPEV